MNVLGITASFSLEDEIDFIDDENFGIGHNSAACLLIDGKIAAAAEQERFDRIKQSKKAPVDAMRYCLESSNVDFSEIDVIAVNFLRDTVNLNLLAGCWTHREHLYRDASYYIDRICQKAFGMGTEGKKVVFIPHHHAHAESVFELSGFQDALVMIIDAAGDDCSGIIQIRENGASKTLEKIPIQNSLGLMYTNMIRHLGYYFQDEYKVMGMAAYGDPLKYKNIFSKMVTFLPDGKYKINSSYFALMNEIAPPRKKGDKFLPKHFDIAAAIQDMLEGIELHILEYYKALTGAKNLCISGGVAHNCLANGKIYQSGMFDNIFVHPASHDGGTAVGAAILAYKRTSPVKAIEKYKPYLGMDIPEEVNLQKELQQWKYFFSYEKFEDITKKAADLLAKDNIIAWFQGRAEFGPRALGNRSIIANPSNTDNRQIINRIIKQREDYRPFAPAILEEHVEDFIVLNSKQRKFQYMSFALPVRESTQHSIAAAVHRDGTARFQTVSKEDNALFSDLIQEFYKKTGVPALINTSFNNYAEPIVNTVSDAINAYLSMDITYMVVGNYLLTKKRSLNEYLWELCPKLTGRFVLSQQKHHNKVSWLIFDNLEHSVQYTIREELYKVLSQADGTVTWRKLFESSHICIDPEMEQQINKLWNNRVLSCACAGSFFAENKEK